MLYNKNQIIKMAGDASVVKSTDCVSRGPRLITSTDRADINYMQPQFQEILCLYVHQVPERGTNVYAGKSHIHIKIFEN